MRKTLYTLLTLSGLLVLTSCQDTKEPNYQYMPNMYETVGYDAYQPSDIMPDGASAMTPADHTVARGKKPYQLENTLQGKELSRELASPLDSLQREDNLAEGAELYAIYCAVCHGARGDGQGRLVQREKILGVPSYDDAGRNITVGTTYHVIYYGQNAMGSYANQLDEMERWQVSEYVMKLKEDLTK